MFVGSNQIIDNCSELRPSYTYLDLFRTPNLRKITILVMILWSMISLEYDTTIRNIANLNFNIYVSFMIMAALELPADLLSIIGINKIGRRWSASLSLVLVGATILPCAWLSGRKTERRLNKMKNVFWQDIGKHSLPLLFLDDFLHHMP